MEKKLKYLGVLVAISFLLFHLVDWLLFKGLNGFDAICMLLSIIAAHLITVRLLDH